MKEKINKIISLSSAQKKQKQTKKTKLATHIPVICLGQISLQAFPRRVFSPPVMDKAVLVQLHLWGMFPRARKLLEGQRDPALCTCRGRCKGEVKTTVIQQDTSPYLIVFLFFHGGKLDKKS